MDTSTTEPPPPEHSSHPKTPQFPPHKEPRVWFLTDGLSPIAISLSRHLLEHGDYVVAGILPSECNGSRGDELRELLKDVVQEGVDDMDSLDEDNEMDIDPSDDAEHVNDNGEQKDDGDAVKPLRRRRQRWRERYKLVGLDGRILGQCQSAIAEALGEFKKIDVLVICRSEALVGSIEELSQSDRTQSLVRDQFETNFFAPVNVIKSILPAMRARRNGHIIAVTGITGHLGTPGLGMYCSSQWALEGYCDSLAYEIAPFNTRMTIVQPNLEIGVLTNKIVSVPQLPEYASDVNPAPLSRDILSALLDRLDGISEDQDRTPETAERTSPHSIEDTTPRSNFTPDENQQLSSGDLLHASTIESLYPTLQQTLKASLIAETVFALAAIGGHDNPPARHIVGFEGVTSVKEKLKTVSEELEDFVEVSSAVDIAKEGGGVEET